jgi:inner membrane protein involved in colicin E2 resistance
MAQAASQLRQEKDIPRSRGNLAIAIEFAGSVALQNLPGPLRSRHSMESRPSHSAFHGIYLPSSTELQREPMAHRYQVSGGRSTNGACQGLL